MTLCNTESEQFNVADVGLHSESRCFRLWPTKVTFSRRGNATGAAGNITEDLLGSPLNSMVGYSFHKLMAYVETNLLRQ